MSVEVEVFESPPLCKTYFVDGLLVDAGFLVDRDVKLLVLTHCHIDHIFFANRIKEKTGCKLAVGRKAAEHLKNMDSHVLHELFGAVLKPIVPDILLKDGDTVRAGKFRFTVFETPGHTEGSICLYELDEKILFSGDTWFGGGSFGRTDLPGGSREELKKSIGRLEKLDVKKLFPGH